MGCMLLGETDMKSKVTSRSLDYAAKVHYNKYIKLKHARDKYMKDRSSKNFNEVKRLSEDFDRFNGIYINRLMRIGK